MLVTLQQARDHLRSDETADDADLTLKINAASAAVLDYLGDYVLTFQDEFGEPLVIEDVAVPVPFRVQQATLIMVNYLYRERDGGQEHAVPSQYGYGFALPQGATALLFSLRRPSLA